MNSSQTFGVILLVEDEAPAREVIADTLRDAGWDVLEGEQRRGRRPVPGLGADDRHHFHRHPAWGRLSGWDVAEQGRASRAAMPVIYASGNSVDRSRSRRVEDGPFFEKLYDTARAVEACRRLRQV